MRKPEGFTVAQLIEKLKKMPQEAVVVVQRDHGDYWNTQRADQLNDVTEFYAVWSDRVGGFVVPSDDQVADRPERMAEVVIIE